MSGESEEKIRNLFDKAAASAPSLIFIDEIDAITPKRNVCTRYGTSNGGTIVNMP